MAYGVVKRKVADKGFGFVADEQTGVEHFFHRSAVKGTTFESLQEGQRVAFDDEPSSKGPRAGNLRVA